MNAKLARRNLMGWAALAPLLTLAACGPSDPIEAASFARQSRVLDD